MCRISSIKRTQSGFPRVTRATPVVRDAVTITDAMTPFAVLPSLGTSDRDLVSDSGTADNRRGPDPSRPPLPAKHTVMPRGSRVYFSLGMLDVAVGITPGRRPLRRTTHG